MVSQTQNKSSFNSALVEGHMMHHRFSPKPHHLQMPLFMFLLDLDELPALIDASPLLRFGAFGLYSFFAPDHLPHPDDHSAEAVPLKEKIRHLLAQEGLTMGTGRVFLLTHLRVMGYVFNPVSLYYCTDSEGMPLAVVAEVENTFHERKAYVLQNKVKTGQGSHYESVPVFRLQTPKHFYVSPFLALDDTFDFVIEWPQALLPEYIRSPFQRPVRATVTTRRESKPVLVGTVSVCPKPFSTARLLWLTLKYPFMTLQVIVAIHWHAFCLWVKGVPFFAKDFRPHLQRHVLQPLSNRTMFASAPLKGDCR